MFTYLTEGKLEDAGQRVNEILSHWLEFEGAVINMPHNQNYFREYTDEKTGLVTRDLNFDNYYKGSTLNQDLHKHFKSK